MSLFVLREGYQVITTPAGGRIVHLRTGDVLDLSPEEVQLFARATTAAVDGKDPKLRSLVRKFASLGLLVAARDVSKTATASVAPPSAAPAASGGDASSKLSSPSAGSLVPLAAASSSGPASTAPVPPKPKPEDVARLFRADLKIGRRASSSLFDVTDPISGKTFPLYDFEISLTRMLDGRRRYSDVIEAGQRLGIPVNLESLLQFVRQLELYGFLAPPGLQLSDARKSMRPPRQKWDESIRALFQSGLRMYRQGRYAEAANYFEAMLEQDSQNPEALDMLEQARQRISRATVSGKEAPPSVAEPAQVGFDELLVDDVVALLPEISELSPPALPQSQPTSQLEMAPPAARPTQASGKAETATRPVTAPQPESDVAPETIQPQTTLERELTIQAETILSPETTVWSDTIIAADESAAVDSADPIGLTGHVNGKSAQPDTGPTLDIAARLDAADRLDAVARIDTASRLEPPAARPDATTRPDAPAPDAPLRLEASARPDAVASFDLRAPDTGAPRKVFTPPNPKDLPDISSWSQTPPNPKDLPDISSWSQTTQPEASTWPNLAGAADTARRADVAGGGNLRSDPIAAQPTTSQSETVGPPEATVLQEPIAAPQSTELTDDAAELPAFPVVGDHRVRNAARPRTGPEPPRTRWLLMGIVVSAVTGISAAAWYFYSVRFEVTPDATQVRVTKKRSAPKKQGPASSNAASVVPDGGALLVTASGQANSPARDAAAIARVDGGSMQDARVSPVVAAARTDGGPAHDSRILPDAGEALAGGSRVEVGRIAMAVAVGAADGETSAPQTAGQWITARIENRGRVTMGEVLAPLDGMISWRASPQQRVRRNEIVGSIQPQGGEPLSLRAPKDGLLIPKDINQTEARKDEQLARIVYHEAFLQASVRDVSPEPGWNCEVFQQGSGAKAACKIVTVAKRGDKYFITATTEPMWFDTADEPRLRVSPPR